MRRWFVGSFVFTLMLVSGIFSSAQDVDVFNDGRLNFKADAPVVAFCRYDGGLEVFAALGGVVFEVNRIQVQGALAQAQVDGTTVQIAAGGYGGRLVAYPDGGLLLTGDGGYQFTIPKTACNGFAPDFNAVLGVITDGDSLTAQGLATPAPLPTTTTTVTTASATTHTVQQGENLYRIGLRYGVHYSELASYNGIADVNTIYVGQVIKIP